jgi:hypothetical protein
MAVSLLHTSNKQRFIDQESLKVEDKMSHLKKLVGAKSRLGIFNAITVQLGTLVEDSPNNRHQMIASNMHSSLLLWWKEVGPHVDQRCRSIDSLQFF